MQVMSLVGAEKVSLHPDDMLLLSNFVISSESFRTSESFTPICLPRFNPMAFLYAYVQYLDVDTHLMLHSDVNSFVFCFSYDNASSGHTEQVVFDAVLRVYVKTCLNSFLYKIRIETVLLKLNVLSEVQRSILDGGVRVEDLPVDTFSPNGSSSPHLGQPRLCNRILIDIEIYLLVSGVLLDFGISTVACLNQIDCTDLTKSFLSPCMLKMLVPTKLSSEETRTMFYFVGSSWTLNSMRLLIPCQTRFWQ